MFVLNNNREPLIPCKPQRSRKILKNGDAKVLKRAPFTIKFVHGNSGYKQELLIGIYTGSKTIKCGLIGLGQVIYQSQVALCQYISKKMVQRAMYLYTYRGRMSRYRPARWENKASMRRNGRLASRILIALCEDFHHDLHVEQFELKMRESCAKHAKEIGILMSRLKYEWSFTETFWYENKHMREKVLQLPNEDYFDNFAICLGNDEYGHKKPVAYFNRHVSKGVRSEKQIPFDKAFWLKKHDIISTPQCIGFVKGRRSAGYFVLETITGNKIHASANIMKNTMRISTLTTTLTQPMKAVIAPVAKTTCILTA
ncbi:RRXRR domain-containing protein [Sinobacterium caligoides]|uniref:RRXRR domain-containing protein n=1 Tax=Sinobacterium caligoides TaxID=933926 RepID=UPI001B8839A9|nr:RRXRR domain-containing protein [Sinobacterium caligoides]